MANECMFVRNVNPKTQNELNELDKRIRGIIYFTNKDKKFLAELINLNLMSFYDKIPLVEIGTIVTCCTKEEGILKQDAKYGSAWKEGVTYRVNDIVKSGHLFACFGIGNGGYALLGGLRLATEKEKEEFLNREKNG